MIRKVLFSLCGLLALGAAAVSILTTNTNCGGNCAALARIGNIATLIQLSRLKAPDHAFLLGSVDSKMQDALASNSRELWINRARFLVTTEPILPHETQPRRVLVVCDTPYNNIPEKWFGSAPPTHAAYFADGSMGLISTAEFAALDRSKFKPLDERQPAKAE